MDRFSIQIDFWDKIGKLCEKINESASDIQICHHDPKMESNFFQNPRIFSGTIMQKLDNLH